MHDSDDKKARTGNNDAVQGDTAPTPKDIAAEQDSSSQPMTEHVSHQPIPEEAAKHEAQPVTPDTPGGDGTSGQTVAERAIMPEGEPPASGQMPATEKKEEEKPRSIWREVTTWMRDLVIAAAICLLLIIYVAQPFRVEKTSMEPLLYDGDRILVSKISLMFEPINRGDIVVLWNPRDPKESWIKRVIGLPGDYVQIVDGIIYINGTELNENYILEEERNPPKNTFPSRNAEWLVENYPDRMEEFGFVQMENWETNAGIRAALRVPDGYYFVVGDHRRFSMDSRDSVYPEGESGPGVIPLKYIYGKAIFRYWPLNKIGPIQKPDYE